MELPEFLCIFASEVKARKASSKGINNNLNKAPIKREQRQKPDLAMPSERGLDEVKASTEWSGLIINMDHEGQSPGHT